jgi:hypothetical protein
MMVMMIISVITILANIMMMNQNAGVAETWLFLLVRQVLEEDLTTETMARVVWRAIVAGQELPSIQEKLCQNMTSHCKPKNRDKVFKGKRKDYEWTKKDANTKRVDNLMAHLEMAGVIGSQAGDTGVADRFEQVLKDLEMSGEL